MFIFNENIGLGTGYVWNTNCIYKHYLFDEKFITCTNNPCLQHSEHFKLAQASPRDKLHYLQTGTPKPPKQFNFNVFINMNTFDEELYSAIKSRLYVIPFRPFRDHVHRK